MSSTLLIFVFLSYIADMTLLMILDNVLQICFDYEDISAEIVCQSKYMAIDQENSGHQISGIDGPSVPEALDMELLHLLFPAAPAIPPPLIPLADNGATSFEDIAAGRQSASTSDFLQEIRRGVKLRRVVVPARSKRESGLEEALRERMKHIRSATHCRDSEDECW